MKPKSIVAALLAFGFSTAFAGETPAILSIIHKKINELKTRQVGDYQLAWGKPTSAIDAIIAEAAANGSTTSGLLAAINSARDSATDTDAATQSCVISLVTTSSGAYKSSRECTTAYADRRYMDTQVYAAIPAYLVGRLPNIDFAQNNDGMGYVGVYAPGGRLSEFIIFSNITQ